MIYKRTAIILATVFLVALSLVCLKLRNDSRARASIESALPSTAEPAATPALPAPNAAP